MVSALGAGLSGLAAHDTLVDVTARNLANVNSQGYKRREVALRESAALGAEAGVRTDGSPGPLFLEPGPDGGTPTEASNVDLSRELVNLIVGSRGFEANLQSIRTEDEMLGTLLDIRR